MDWREPVTLKTATETSGVYGISRTHNEVMAEIDISTEKGKRDMHMLQNGTMCNFCYETFPERPSAALANDPEFKTKMLLYIDLVEIEVQEERCRAGACPFCGLAVDNSIIEKMIYDEAMSMAKAMYDKLQEDDR